MFVDNISEAELEIMKVLWKKSEPISSHDVCTAVSHKNWKRTTVSTLLSRFCEKGVISGEKSGNTYYYSPLISAKAYRKCQTRKLMRNFYNGSLKDFAVSLFEDEGLSDKEIGRLKAIFDDKEE